jgi:hypothetical protein
MEVMIDIYRNCFHQKVEERTGGEEFKTVNKDGSFKNFAMRRQEIGWYLQESWRQGKSSLRWVSG